MVEDSGKWATFHLGGEVYALRAEDVQEVLMPQPLTPVPLAPEYIAGLLNLRGQIMPAIELRSRLRLAKRDANDSGSLLVIKVQDRLVSLVVDQIGDVLELPPHAWQPPPPTMAAQHREFVFAICPIDGEVVLGLKAESLTGDDDHATA